MSGSIFQGFEEQLNQTAEDILPYYWKNNTNGRHEYYKLFLMNLTSLFIALKFVNHVILTNVKLVWKMILL